VNFANGKIDQKRAFGVFEIIFPEWQLLLVLLSFLGCFACCSGSSRCHPSATANTTAET